MPHRTNDQKLHDRAILAEKYLQGHRIADIAPELGISVAQVYVDLQIIREQWAASAILNLNEAKNRELARIDLIEKELWVDFYQSRETSNPKLGDPQYMRLALDCTKQRRAILGVDQPTQHHHTHGEQTEEQRAIAALSDSELDRLKKSLESGGAKGKPPTVH